MSDVLDILKSMDDITDIACHSIHAAKQHSISSITDLMAIFKDVEDLIKEVKPAGSELKATDASAKEALLQHSLECMQKIFAAVV